MNNTNGFYVGYLRTPSGLVRFLKRLVPVVVAGVAVGAWFLSRAQNDPGPGVWHDGAQTLVGRISATPYPLIRIVSARSGVGVETVLLVSEGKRGGGERIAAVDGRVVTVRGTVLERDGRRLLELAAGDAVAPDGSLSKSDADRLASIDRRALGSVVLRGEIIDPKCYCGAMKPGEGRAHKECATLCIAGGIPPMFVTIDAAGLHRYYLLTDSNGHALDECILPYVADAVEVRGVLEQVDDLQILRIDPAAIRRL